MSDDAFARYLLTSATGFTQEQLVPGARVAVFFDSPNIRQPRTIVGLPFTRDGDPMYVEYQTPLPPGVSGMFYGGGIGTLDMGKITPIVEWKQYGNELSFQGWAGTEPVFLGLTTTDRYVISAGRAVRVKSDAPFADAGVVGVNPDLGLPGGAECRIAPSGSDYYLEARSPTGSRMRLIDAPMLHAALRGFEKRPTIRTRCFRFADRDFVEFYTDYSSPMLYRIDTGALTLIGAGAVWGGDAKHILLMYAGDWPRHWYNEEEAPK